jgi:DNA-binding transcriptional ArsR family regulator
MPVDLSADDLAPRADEAAGLLRALAHPGRLMICCLLREGERAVSDIEAALDIKQPRLSRELSKLREAGLVDTRRVSKAVFYRLADERAACVIDGVCSAMGEPPAANSPAASPAPPPRRGGYGVFARTKP